MKGKVAFIVWNTFQLLQFKPLLQALPTALLVIEKRPKSQEIDRTLLETIPNNVAYINSKNVFNKLDGKFDILITQTVFEQLYLFKATKIVMLQYGYAKEPHNYGAWRALADLNLVYGQYAYERISYFSPTEIVGCPRYQHLKENSFYQKSYDKYKSLLDPNKQTILYAPSWGELSSFSTYINTLYEQTKNYNVLVKLHHNTILLNKTHDTKSYQTLFFGVHFFYENEDILELISISDIVISDYSGAIFDAFFCEKQLILVSIPELKAEKIDQFSLEVSARHLLGIEVLTPDELEQILSNPNQMLVNKSINNGLFSLLFHTEADPIDNIIKCLENVLQGQYQLNQQQLYVRQVVQQLYLEKHKKEKNNGFGKIGKKISNRILRR